MTDEKNKIDFITSNDILSDMQHIIEQSRNDAYKAINVALLKRNWLIGYRIEQEVIKNGSRAEYGLQVIKKLAKDLTVKYGKGFTKTNIYSFYSFYKDYKNIFHSASGKSENLLSWTHYRVLLSVSDKIARAW